MEQVDKSKHDRKQLAATMMEVENIILNQVIQKNKIE